MKKLIKWLLAGVLTLTAVLLAALFLLPRFFDPNDHKERIETMLTSTTGREVRLNGPIQWEVFPWLALEFRDVTIANEKGFDGDHLARIDTLSARLKVAPLLKKQLRVGTVSVSGTDLNLQVAHNGRSNWQGIVEALAAEEDAPATQERDPASADLKISGIQINDLRIHYQNRPAGFSATLEEASLYSSRIEPEQPVAIELSAKATLPESGLQGKLSGQLQLRHLFDDQGLTVAVDSFQFDGQWSGGDAPVPLTITLPEPARIAVDTGDLDFPQVRLNLANATLQASASGNWQGAGSYQGRLQANDFDLQHLLSTLGGSPLVFSNPEAMSRFSLNSSWRIQGQRLQLPDLSAQLDQTRITGQIDFTSLENLAGKFALTLDQLIVDDYLPAEDDSAPSATTAATQPGELDFGHLDGTVRIEDMRAFGVRFGETELNVQTRGGSLKIVPMRAQFYQGLLNTQVLVDFNAPRNKVKLTSQAQSFQVGELMQDVAGKAWVSGLGQLQADVTIDDPFAPSPMKTAHGQVSYRLSDGAIYGVDLLATVEQAIKTLQSLRKNAKTPENKAVSGAATGKTRKTEFTSIRFAGDIQQGILNSRELALETPFLQVRGQVAIDLDALTIDANLEPTLTKLPQKWVGEHYRALLNRPIPVRLSGPLTAPEIRIDVAKLLLASQKKRIDEKKKELESKLLDSLLGTDKRSGKEKPEHSERKPEEGKAEKHGGEKPESTEDKLKRKLINELFGGDD